MTMPGGWIVGLAATLALVQILAALGEWKADLERKAA